MAYSLMFKTSQMKKVFVFFNLMILLTFVKPILKGQCISAIYQSTKDYIGERYSPQFKAIMNENANQQHVIYKILQTSKWSLEWPDSIAYACTKQNRSGLLNEIILHDFYKQQTFFIFPLKIDTVYFKTNNPGYLQNWDAPLPVEYNGIKGRYFKLRDKANTNYVIFDPLVPSIINIKLLNGIPGLVVEAKINTLYFKLIEFNTLSCDIINEKLKHFNLERSKKISTRASLDVDSFHNPWTDIMWNTDFKCIDN